MTNISQKQQYKWIFIILLFSVVSSEWTYGIEGNIPLIIRRGLTIIPLLLLLYVYFRFKFHKIHEFNILLKVGIVISLSLMVLKLIGLFENDSLNQIVTFIQSIVFLIIGYSLGNHQVYTLWLINRIALFGVIVSLLIVVKIFLISSTLAIYLPSGFTLIFSVFSYVFYLYNYLTSSLNKVKNFILFFFAAMGIFLSFLKPLIFTIIIATGTIILLVFLTNRKKLQIVRKLSIVVLFIVLVFTFGNFISNNKLADTMVEIIYTKFLRLDQKYDLSDFNAKDIEGASGGRLGIWEMGFEKLEGNYWFGIGERRIFNGPFGAIPAHNWYLDLLIWIGLIGSIPLFIGIVWWVLFTIKNLHLHSDNGLLVPVFAYNISILAFAIGTSLLSFSTIQSFLFLFMAILVKTIRLSKNIFHDH